MIKKFTMHSYEDTIYLGIKLGHLTKNKMVFILEGDLGAGKTTLTKGIAKGLGIDSTVTSPTFTILKIYKGRLNLYHFDAYRLEGVSHELGFEEYINQDGLSVIEWSNHLVDLLPSELLKIEITYIDDETREITLTSMGEQYDDLLKEL